MTYNKNRNKELEFAPGDKVYLSTKNLVTDEGTKKLSDLCTGPFEVLKKIGDGAYKLKLPPHVKVNLVFCNKTNPIFELYTFFQSFCIPYHFLLCCHVIVRLIEQPPCSSTHDQELTHVTVTLTM